MPSPTSLQLVLLLLSSSALLQTAGASAAEEPNAVNVDAHRRKYNLEAFFLQEARAIKDEMIAIRRDFHMWPELSLEEHNTTDRIKKHLEALGLPYSTPIPTGLIATIAPTSPPSSPAPTVALRADTDALPIQESLASQENLEAAAWFSRVAGKMHACGHDAHMAMLLGAARLLRDRAARGELEGEVMLVFQPAEEGKGGAKRMIEAGALEGVTAIFGIHVWPDAPTGTIGTRAGTIMAASDRFRAVVQGRGGHAAMPHLALDPIPAAASIALALQALVSRETDPNEAAVVSLTRFNTGPGAANVIPDSVVLEGTVRALATDRHRRLKARIAEILHGFAAANGLTASLDWSAVPYPATRNDAGLTRLATRAAGNILGPDNALDLEHPSMAAEDFSFYTEQAGIPSSFAFLGVGGKDGGGTAAGLHSPQFRMDDEAMPYGAAYLASCAVLYLQEAQGGGGPGGIGGVGGARGRGGGLDRVHSHWPHGQAHNMYRHGGHDL